MAAPMQRQILHHYTLQIMALFVKREKKLGERSAGWLTFRWEPSCC